MLLYLAYLAALMANVKAVSRGKLAPELGVWWIHLIIFVIAVYLHGRQTGFWVWRFANRKHTLNGNRT